MGRILAISDIHGYKHQLEELLLTSRYDAAQDQLFVLGDFINKGPDSLGTLACIRRLVEQGAIAIQGNNERKWLKQFPEELQRDQRERARIQQWLNGLPLWAEYGEFVFVHAGIRPGIPLDRQTAEDLTEIREPFHASSGLPGRTIVFGHTPTFRFGVPGHTVWIGEGKIGIDTGAGHGFYLSLVDLTNGVQYTVPVTGTQGMPCQVSVLDVPTEMNMTAARDLDHNDNDDVEESDEIFTPVMTIDEGLEVLPTFGIHYTEEQFKERLQQLALIADIEEFPVGEFFCFLHGALITNPPISERLYNNRERILDEMQRVEGKMYEMLGQPAIILYEQKDGGWQVCRTSSL